MVLSPVQKLGWGKCVKLRGTSPPAAPLLTKERFRDFLGEMFPVPLLAKERLGEVKRVRDKTIVLKGD